WATPTDEVAALAGIDVAQVIRFDQNTAPQPLPSSRPGTIAKALAGINNYPPGGYKELHRAIADYNGVDPANVVIGLGADDLILLRTFSKAFALAGARVGYALASRDVARELNARQAPAPVTSLSAALAVAALASPPDVRLVVDERERLAASLRALGLEPLP